MMKRAKSPSSGQKTASACEATRTTQPFAQRQKPNVAPTFRRISGYSCGVFFQRAPMPRCADGRGSLLGAQASSPGLRPVASSDSCSFNAMMPYTGCVPRRDFPQSDSRYAPRPRNVCLRSGKLPSFRITTLVYAWHAEEERACPVPDREKQYASK